MPRSFSRGSDPSPLGRAPFGASFISVIFDDPVSSLCHTLPPPSQGGQALCGRVGGPVLWTVRQPGRGGAIDRGNPSRFPRSGDYLIPAAEQTSAPAMVQIAVAVSKPSATTVDSMLALVTHVVPSSDAGSVMLGSAGSTVFPFSSADGTVSPASRMVATATASSASL